MHRSAVLGLSCSLRVGEVATCDATTQSLSFRPFRLITNDAIGEYLIRDIRVDFVSQTTQPGVGIPASVFSATALGVVQLARGTRFEVDVERIKDPLPWLVRAARRWLRIDPPKTRIFSAVLIGEQEEDDT
ncbi:MAG: hypothetical protein ACHQC8_07100 [Solirubrobacterales bacterium]